MTPQRWEALADHINGPQRRWGTTSRKRRRRDEPRSRAAKRPEPTSAQQAELWRIVTSSDVLHCESVGCAPPFKGTGATPAWPSLTPRRCAGHASGLSASANNDIGQDLAMWHKELEDAQRATDARRNDAAREPARSPREST